MQIPTIAAVSGYALGGGFELALATNLRVFGSSATVGLPETRLGIIPGAGGTFRLQTLIGTAKSLEYILTGRRIKAALAMQLGICTEVVLEEGEDGNERVIHKATELAKEINIGGPLAISAVLYALKDPHGQSVGNRAKEDSAYFPLLFTEDRTEALKAFKEKRNPVFKGR